MLSSHLKEPVRYFLLVINSNLGPISRRFRHMASFSLKTHISPIPPFIQPQI